VSYSGERDFAIPWHFGTAQEIERNGNIIKGMVLAVKILTGFCNTGFIKYLDPTVSNLDGF
jgi:hypothetical protein